MNEGSELAIRDAQLELWSARAESDRAVLGDARCSSGYRLAGREHGIVVVDPIEGLLMLRETAYHGDAGPNDVCVEAWTWLPGVGWR